MSSQPFFAALARFDPPGGDNDLDETMRTLARDRAQPPFEGEDATRTVWVRVSGRGRVENVEFSTSWSGRLQPGDVARALTESYTDARNKAATAAAVTAYGNQLDGAEQTAPPGVAVVEVPPVDDVAWLRGVHNTLEDIAVDIHRRARGEIDRTEQEAVTSPTGCFRARVQGETVVEITGDAQAIRGRSAEHLRQEALAVFRRAQGETDGPEPTDGSGSWQTSK